MSEGTDRRLGELVRGVFSILIDAPEGLAAKDLLAKLEQSIELTEFEKTDYPNRPGVRRFEKIVRFATIAPVKAGWLVKTKGKWLLTDDGKAAFEIYTNPEEFTKKARELYKKWRITQPSDVVDAESEPEAAVSSVEEAEESAWSEVQNYLRDINPYALQDLVAALLRAMGYFVSWVSPKGPDRGIDIIAHADALGAQTPRIKVQVKRQDATVDVNGLRSFLALLGDQDFGIFVCTGGFTSSAQSEARSDQRRRIVLVDMEKLFDLWVEHYAKVQDKDKRLLPLRAIYYLDAGE